MHYLVLLIKNVVLAICLIYGINLIIINAGYVIPINYFTITSVSLFGFPALVGLLILQKLL